MSRRVVPLLFALALGASAQEPVPVQFVVNDALVANRMLEGTSVRAAQKAGASAEVSGATDASGTVTLRLAPGTWFVSYELMGYVPLRDTPIEVKPQATQVFTVSLLPALEGEPGAPVRRRIALVLNWGSDESNHLPDCDSHLAVETTHVYFGNRQATLGASELHLDVDDRSWGGPETITVLDPVPGLYTWWVHAWSTSPGTIGSSDVVVRLMVGDEVARTWQAPALATGRLWRPFRHLEVRADGSVDVAEFTDGEKAANEPLRLTTELEEAIGWSAATAGSSGDETLVGICCLVVFVIPAALAFAAWLFKKSWGKS